MTEDKENYGFYTVTLYGTRKPLAMPFELNFKNMEKLSKMEKKGTKADLIVEFEGLTYSFDDLLEFYAAPYMLAEVCEPLMIVKEYIE